MSLSFPSDIAVVYALKEINRHNISWSLVSGATSYDVYRCGHRYGDFTLVGNSTSSSYSELPPITLYKTWYYKVLSKNDAESSSLSAAYSVEDFSPFDRSFTYTSTSDFDYYSDEDVEFQIDSMRKQVLAHLEYGSEYVYLFKRKYSTDENEGEDDGLGEAFGRKGEYWDPYTISVRFVNPDEKISRFIGGDRVEIVQRPWTAYLPHKIILQNRDIIVNRQNERFDIDAVSYRRFRGYCYRQEFNVVKTEKLEGVTELDATTPLG